MSLKKIIALIVALGLAGCAGLAFSLIYITSSLPDPAELKEYKPRLVSTVYDRNSKKIGEFFKQKRKLTPYEKFPKIALQAFVSAEDADFYNHQGVNPRAIFRAALVNIKEGRKAQGASTITQQVAKSLLLTSEKTYIRKIKEIFLAYKIEKTLSKEDILYLYLNQIYFGQGAYGMTTACEVYFKKPITQITLAEAALLAGLPKAPSRFSPIHNARAAKNRQRYVLSRMVNQEFITPEAAAEAVAQPIQIFKKEDPQKVGPFYLEIIRQMLVKKIGEKTLLDEGIKIYTSLDANKQEAAKKAVKNGLHDLDKRQGYRGPTDNITDTDDVAEFLLTTREEILDVKEDSKILKPDGTFEERGPLNLTGVDENGQRLPNLPDYIEKDLIVKAVVTKVSDRLGLVYVRFAEAKGLIDSQTMSWAREPNPQKRARNDKIKYPSQALKRGDIILVKVIGSQFRSRELERRANKNNLPKPDVKSYAAVELEQTPQAESALISFDLETGDVVAMIGGYDFKRSKFNRSLQAVRQTGSAFKALVYSSALDRGFNPATKIVDAPVVFEKSTDVEKGSAKDKSKIQVWKPRNHSKKFAGDILFRKALIKSLNVPTVKVLERTGVKWVAEYAKRLGIFNPLNMDLSAALGSSSITPYELNKVFSHIARLGRRIRPVLIDRVVNAQGVVLAEKISLEEYFEKSISKTEEELEERRKKYLELEAQLKALMVPAPVVATPPGQAAGGANPNNQKEEFIIPPENKKKAAKIQRELRRIPPLYFEDPDQLMKETTAYVATSLLQATIFERGGTGARARGLRRPAAGKTGSTSDYFDAWFAGFTPQIATTVWVGHDNERSLGVGEVGGKSALPIWVDYMIRAHRDLPTRYFKVPNDIVFANIDPDKGTLATAASGESVKQAFVEGTEPTKATGEVDEESEADFLKDALTE